MNRHERRRAAKMERASGTGNALARIRKKITPDMASSLQYRVDKTLASGNTIFLKKVRTQPEEISSLVRQNIPDVQREIKSTNDNTVFIATCAYVGFSSVEDTYEQAVRASVKIPALEQMALLASEAQKGVYDISMRFFLACGVQMSKREYLEGAKIKLSPLEHAGYIAESSFQAIEAQKLLAEDPTGFSVVDQFQQDFERQIADDPRYADPLERVYAQARLSGVRLAADAYKLVYTAATQ